MTRKKLEKILNFDLFISCTAMAVLILLTFGAVVMRYFINRPIIWGEEVQLFCIVLVVFFGAGAGFRTGSHVAIDIVVDLLPKKVQRVIEIIIYIISLFVLIYFLYQSFSFTRQMFETERTTEILSIPYFITYSAFPLGCVLMILNYTLSVYFRLTGGEAME
jgi:TRAP-type C4-dicarboxylate transport system permease small subunit